MKITFDAYNTLDTINDLTQGTFPHSITSLALARWEAKNRPYMEYIVKTDSDGLKHLVVFYQTADGFETLDLSYSTR